MNGSGKRAEVPDPQRTVAAALRYAGHGWPVLPVHTPTSQGCSCPTVGCGSPGKHPRTRQGVHDASCDRDTIAGWWRRWPHANLAVATGTDSGLLVIDVDLPDGPASLHQLETVHGRLPATCRQITGSGGHQLLYRHPDHDQIGNRAGLVAGVDVRGDGGYIVVPPSIHPTGNRYRWADHTRRADAPGWLLDLTRTRDRNPVAIVTPPPAATAGGPVGDRQARYVAAALDRELATLARAVEGTRNHSLNRAAFSLGQLVAAGRLDADRVAGELERVATGIGLGTAEIRRTVASGLTAAADKPGRPPTPAAVGLPTADPGVPVRRIGPRRR